MPKTIDELYNVLRAFTFNDPDGNGRNDTYGLAGCVVNGVGFGYMWQVFYAFGVQPGANFTQTENQIIPDFIRPEINNPSALGPKVHRGALNPSHTKTTELKPYGSIYTGIQEGFSCKFTRVTYCGPR